ncbi:unnamed protein product [Cyprideis torosa]|uniref:Uncharacterized protein n=1 Tax=Cyprideis torosa TaxID=163714 RepID=A0A7R8W0U3_9CRUS|nr:unnamed protein product [Cyprideis torosa]CAG0880139.1 unnamed protein product [Cyprideis torosa]
MPGSSRVVQKDVKKVRSSESKTPRVALRSPIAARKKRSPEVLKPRRKLVSDDACSGMTRPKEGAAKPKGQSKKIVLPAASHDGDENLGSSNGIVESREAAGSSVDVLSVPVKKRRGRPPRVKSAEDTIGSSTAEGKSGPQSGEGIPGKESTKKKVVGKQSAARQQSVAEMVNSRTQKKSKGHQRGRQVSSSSSTAKTSEKEDEGDGPRGRARRSVSSSDESDRRAAPKTRVVSRATPSKGSNKKETPRSKKESPSQKESSSRSLSARGRKKVVKIAPEKNRDESLTDDEKKEKIRVKKKVGRRKSRVASLNAMAMVHCMYENEALRSPSSTSEGGASRGDARSPETFEEKADKKKPSRAVTKKKEQKKTETVKKESSESDERPLKDLVMPKRIASLNASAILAASYSPMEPPKKKWINEIVKKEQSEGGQSQPSAVTSEESKPMKKRKIDVSTTDGEGSSGGKRRKEATESSTAGSTSHRGEAGATVSSQEIKVDEGDSNSAKGVEEMDVIVADQDLTFAGLAYINRPKDASTAEFAVQTYRISSRSCPAPGANGGKVTLRSQTVVHKTQETQILQRPGQISEVTSTSTKSYSPLGALSTMRPTLPPTMSLATATVDSTHHHHSVPITPSSNLATLGETIRKEGFSCSGSNLATLGETIRKEGLFSVRPPRFGGKKSCQIRKANHCSVIA